MQNHGFPLKHYKKVRESQVPTGEPLNPSSPTSSSTSGSDPRNLTAPVCGPDLAQYTMEIREMGGSPSWSQMAHDLIRDSSKTADNDGAGQKQEEGITR